MRTSALPLAPLLWALASCTQTPDIDCTIDGSIGGQARAWYADGDEDGFGDPASAALACTAPDGWVDNALDCDDDDDAVHPEATELCNGRDDDCDQDADEGVQSTWWLDADGDGHGAGPETTACAAPARHVAVGDDCDDTRAAVFPGATEACDGVDTDCDPRTVDPITMTCYGDGDGDGFGDPAAPVPTCEPTCPLGSVEDDTDCLDDNEDAYPGAVEVCDGQDNDCLPGTFPDEGANCSTGTDPAFNTANGHVYLVVPSGNNFGGAGNVCGNRGYHLAWIDDAAEATFVEDLAEGEGNVEPLWVGLAWTACGQSGPFRRVDDRTSPDSCAAVGAYEATLLNGVAETGAVTLWDGALDSAHAADTYLWYVCEAEP